MFRKVRFLLATETFRYLLFGGLTVLVNIISYHVLILLLETFWANTLAFFIAVLFAYWANSRFVFRLPCTKKIFIQFMAMRIGTLLIDDGGMLLLLNWGWNSLAAKCAVNFVIIVLNYILSKLIVFKKDCKKGDR